MSSNDRLVLAVSLFCWSLLSADGWISSSRSRDFGVRLVCPGWSGQLHSMSSGYLAPDVAPGLLDQLLAPFRHGQASGMASIQVSAV